MPNSKNKTTWTMRIITGVCTVAILGSASAFLTMQQSILRLSLQAEHDREHIMAHIQEDKIKSPADVRFALE